MTEETAPADLSTVEMSTPTEAASPRPKRGSSQGKVLVADKFEVDTARAVAEFSNAYAEAYECSSDGASNDCIAVVLKGRYPARQDVIKVALQADIPGMMILRTTAIVNWTPDSTQRFVLIYRRPLGTPLFNSNRQLREPISEDIIRRNIIRPIFFVLRSLADRAMFHGNIRPDNIFFSGSESGEATLGECASTMPGIIQPGLYETIERGMADPQGRGTGLSHDDIYAFGATVAVLFRGQEPLVGKSDRTIVEEKINRSSFNVLTDGLHLSPGLAEFLRATLNDDPRQRWTIDQVGAWVDGARTTPKPTVAGPRAQRAMDFNGKKYIRPRLLARDMFDNIPEAVGMIESGYLAKWLERALGDHERLEVVNEAIARAAAAGRTQGYEDRLVCYVAMAMDPRAPVRYKEISVFPMGIGGSLTYALLNGIPVQPYAEFIKDKLAWVWYGHKENTHSDVENIMRRFDNVSKLIIRRGINFGMERCVYDLSPYTPCLSDLLQSYYTLDCNNLVNCIDQIAERNKNVRPIDRHIAAFVCVRDTHDNGGLMSAIDSGDKIKMSLGLLTLYQGLQKRSDSPKLTNLCECLHKDAEFVVQRFHNVRLKQDLSKELAKEIKSGSLRRILTLIDSPAVVRKDTDDFNKATMLYRALGNERDRIRTELDRNPTFGQGSGQHIAMVISAILSGVVISSLVLINVLARLKGGL